MRVDEREFAAEKARSAIQCVHIKCESTHELR
jgi:hypothetical protein